jgi:hypothetical protein
VNMTPEQIQRQAEQYIRRKRNMVPPKIDFDQMHSGPDASEMPEYSESRPSHAPILPREEECSQKKS